MKSIKFIIPALVAIICGLSAQAISIDEFYTQYSKLPNRTEVKIPKLLLKLKNRHLSAVKVLTFDINDLSFRDNILADINKINIDEETMVIKSNENEEVDNVIIKPADKNNVIILVTSISNHECDIVYVKCNKKLIDEVLNEYGNENNYS